MRESTVLEVERGNTLEVLGFAGAEDTEEGLGLVFWGQTLEVERETSLGVRVLIFWRSGGKAEGEGRGAQGQPVMLVWCNTLQYHLENAWKRNRLGLRSQLKITSAFLSVDET